MAFTLRDYQQAAIDAVIQARQEGYRRLLVCLPTGAGKTVIFSELCRLASRHVLVLAHREELLTQAADKIAFMTDGLVQSTIEQGDQQAEAASKVVVASIRSLREERINRLQKEHDFGLIIYDECHHSAAEDNKRVLRQLGCFDGDWSGTLLGFTATTTRADGIGLGEVFELIVYERGILDMIKEKFLVPLRGYRINTAVDLQRIMAERDDIEPDHLEEAVDIESRNALVARSIQELARDRRTIAFCVTVRHAINLCKALNALGVPSGVIYGNMHKQKRAETLRLFRQEKLLAITNVGVLTEGFDDPGVSCIAMARPTKSESLYAQCIGRGARKADNKNDCIILDFVDLSHLSLVNLPSLLGLPKEFDLAGGLVEEAVETYHQLHFDFPGFQIEAAEITLSEIKRRAEGFDPLTLSRNAEIRSMSPNAWFSLGAKGLALHYFTKHGSLACYEILTNAKRGKNKYAVQHKGEIVAHFSRITDAVEAVDYELAKWGPIARQSALEEAAWRHSPTPPDIQRALTNLHPPRTADCLGDALGYLVFAEHNPPRKPQPKPKGKGWPKNYNQQPF